MTTFVFKDFLSFFKRSIPSDIFLTNKHMLIFDGHGSHITLEAIEQAQAFGLDMVTLPSHTSHALQPLDITCFKPFKTAFRKEKDTTMVNRNYIDPDNIVLVGWVDKLVDQALSKKKSSKGSKIHGFGHWTLKQWMRK
jgi:hypothetical protein